MKWGVRKDRDKSGKKHTNFNNTEEYKRAIRYASTAQAFERLNHRKAYQHFKNKYDECVNSKEFKKAAAIKLGRDYDAFGKRQVEKLGYKSKEQYIKEKTKDLQDIAWMDADESSTRGKLIFNTKVRDVDQSSINNAHNFIHQQHIQQMSINEAIRQSTNASLMGASLATSGGTNPFMFGMM